MAETFDFEKTSVGLKADLPQSGQVTQPLAEVKVTRVVDGRLGTDSDLRHSGNLFEVLLDTGVFVIDMQGRDYALGQHPGAKTARGFLGYPTLEDQLHLVGTAQVEVFADDLLEENAAAQGRSKIWVKENSACRMDRS